MTVSVSLEERRAMVEDFLAMRMRLSDIVKALSEDLEEEVSADTVAKDITEIRARWAQDFETDMEGQRQEDIAATKLLFRRAMRRNDYASAVGAQKHLSALQGTLPQKTAPGNKDLLQLAAVAGAALEGASAAREAIDAARSDLGPRETEIELRAVPPVETDEDAPSFAEPAPSQVKVQPGNDVGPG